MASFTALQLINRAAAIADMKDGFISTSTWLDWLNDERVALTIFMARHGWPYGETVQSTTMDGSTSTITLSGEPTAIIGVWEQDTSGRYRRLSMRDRVAQMAQIDAGPVGGAAEYWDLSEAALETEANPTIRLYPRPTSGTYVVVYIPSPPAVAQVTDTISYPMRFERRLVLGMALNALTAEESDTTRVEKLIGKMDQIIEEACWDRSLAETPYVRNVDDRARGWTHWILYPPPVNWYWV